MASFMLVSKTLMNESQEGRVHVELSHISVMRNLLIVTGLQ